MPPSDYNRMCNLDNLKRAYRWIQSNPDAAYKNHFRDSYGAYAASSEQNIKRLRKRLFNRNYDPGHASKVYLPKPSGILRPYTLLTVNDQIVYQACANIIADRLAPKVRSRYFKSVFGHLYAGKSSKFFYIKWQKGYEAFADSVIDTVNDGYKYVANFDLTSFYDSIDHHALKYFLKELNVENDLIEFLFDCLRLWTSSTWTHVSNIIYHGHGIPQGPLSSGLLSEVILKYIDDKGAQRGSTKYFRYVDDIKIFAKNESVLRQRLVTLDLAAKDVGLFPQSSKVNIRKVTDPTDEIKTISRPPSPSVFLALDQEKPRKELLEITRRGVVASANTTRFKYLISQLEPNHRLNTRLMKVLERQPFLSRSISSYYSRYNKLPKKAAEIILQFVKGSEIYHSVHAEILFAILENMQDPEKRLCIEFCYKRLFPSGGAKKPPPQPTYKAALIAWTLKNNRLTYAELASIMTNEVDWWVIKDLLKYLREDLYGKASYEQLLNDAICLRATEMARIAALKMVDEDIGIQPPPKTAHEAARLLLFAAGKIRTIGHPESLVGTVLNHVLDKKFTSFDWRRLFGPKHKDAEHIAFTVRRNYESDINGCIVTLDSLCDFIWEAIFKVELPGRTYGNYGAMMKNPTMLSKYPKACKGFFDLHQLRLQSVTAHPRNSKAGTPTRRLKHYEFYKIRPFVKDAINEIITTVSI